MAQVIRLRDVEVSLTGPSVECPDLRQAHHYCHYEERRQQRDHDNERRYGIHPPGLAYFAGASS